MSCPADNNADLVAGEADFYCFGCGYNLRGLAGDPKRCPECGELNPITALVVPATAIKQQLRQLETAPTTCIAAFPVLVIGVLAAARYESAPCCLAPGIIALLAAPLMWWGGMAKFADSCMHESGWKSALRRFHSWGLLLLLLGIGIPIAFWFVFADLSPRLGLLGPEAANRAAYIVSSVVFLIIVRVLGPPIHRRARRGLRPLQQRVAVRLARRAIRTGISQQRIRPR